MEQEHDRIHELIIGLALKILDEKEELEAQRLLESDPAARTLYNEMLQTVDLLAYEAEPASLADGSLGRLRQKAGFAAPVRLTVEFAENHAGRFRSIRQAQTPDLPTRRSPTIFQRPVLAYAAALVFAVTAGLFGILWATGAGRSVSYEQELSTLLAAPNLKITELKAADPKMQGSVRVYADPATNKVYLVTQNLANLPVDKVYEAWVITTRDEPLNAGLVGSGGNNTTVYRLDARGNLDNVKLVAITIEKSGGVDKPSQQPIMVGQLGD